MIKISNETRALLEDIESRIDPETEEDFLAQWRGFLDHKFTGEAFTARRRKTSVSQVPRVEVNINDAIEDDEQMLVSQLNIVSDALAGESGVLSVRSNYGTGILSSLFGAELFVMPREMDTLPTTRPLGDAAVDRLLESGVPDLNTGLGRKVFEMGEIFAEVFEHYPKIKKYVDVYHPDTQGPLDICELLWGGDMFYAMYDEPERVHALLALVTETYARFMEKWFALFPRKSEYGTHWGRLMFKGGILLRDDSAMNLSPEFYEEFARPYDAHLLARFGGGAIHFCGRGDHYIASMSEISGLTGVNLSQPHLNMMEEIYTHTVDKNIQLLDFSPAQFEKDHGRANGFHGNINIL